MMLNKCIPPKATLMGSLCPPPKVSRALANAMSPSYASPSPSLESTKVKAIRVCKMIYISHLQNQYYICYDELWENFNSETKRKENKPTIIFLLMTDNDCRIKTIRDNLDGEYSTQNY